MHQLSSVTPFIVTHCCSSSEKTGSQKDVDYKCSNMVEQRISLANVSTRVLVFIRDALASARGIPFLTTVDHCCYRWNCLEMRTWTLHYVWVCAMKGFHTKHVLNVRLYIAWVHLRWCRRDENPLHNYVYGAHGIQCDKEPLNRMSHMGNYLTVSCHVTTNLVTGGDANCDPSTWAKITPTSHDLQTAEMKVCTLVSPNLMHFVSTVHMYTDKRLETTASATILNIYHSYTTYICFNTLHWLKKQA